VSTTAQRPRRAYRSRQREEQARLTRRRILAAASELFVARGYAGTTMRAIAAKAQVSLPTVELLFGTKTRLLKAAIDVAIAGDDEPVAVLDRDWTRTALRAPTADELLMIFASVLGPAQERSAGLVLALFEGSTTDSDLADLATTMINQRARTAAWLIDILTQKAPLRARCSKDEAIDTVWILMDPAVFNRLTRQRGWPLERYQHWLASSLERLLINDCESQTKSPDD
jgi:TetR/AcrR family transcriptional regulator, regulator of autoinduction and epiphytic fitness